MSRFKLANGRAELLIILTAFSSAIAVFYFSLVSSFRLSEISFEFAWRLNFDRTATLFSAGFALAMGLASNRPRLSLSRHLSIYAAIVLASAGLVLGLLLSWPAVACVAVGLFFGMGGFWIFQQLSVSSAKQNLVLALALYLLFFISIASFHAALGFSDGLGAMVLWLFADTSAANIDGLASLVAVLLVAAWLLISENRDAPSLILLGLSIGLLGPIMFIGYLVPTLLVPLRLKQRSYLLVSGLVGGTVLSLVSVANVLALGGYATGLIVPLAFIGIPVLLWLNRSPKNGSWVSSIEAVSILLIGILSLTIIWHLASFAQQLA